MAMGFLPNVILEGIKGAANSGTMKKDITIRELSTFIESRVPEVLEEYKNTPQFPASYGFRNDISILLLKKNTSCN